MGNSLNTGVGSMVAILLIMNVVSCSTIDSIQNTVDENERKIDEMSDKIDKLQTAFDGSSGFSNGTYYHLDGVSDKIDDIQTDVNYIRLYCK